MEDAIKFAKKETVVFTAASVNQVGTEIDGVNIVKCKYFVESKSKALQDIE